MSSDLPVVFLVFFVDSEHVGFHHWTNGRAGGEEEVHDMDFSSDVFLGDHLAVLVHEGKLWQIGRASCRERV